MRSSQETLLRRALPWPALATGAWSELGSLRLGERGVSGAIVGALIIRIGLRVYYTILLIGNPPNHTIGALIGILYHSSSKEPL